MSTWVQRIEEADHKGNTKEIYQGVKALSGSSQYSTTRPTMHWKPTDQKKNPAATDTRASSRPPIRASGERINGPEELAKVWQDFLAEKFAPTQSETLRAEFDALPDNEEDD